MLLEFSCSNVRSIREEVKLDLRAKNDDTFEANLINFENDRINAACAIYGSNATGKTSILTAMGMMKNMVISSHLLQPGDMLIRIPHRLWQEKPTGYSMTFVWKKIRYEYSFSYNDTHILKETLSYYPNGRITVIFNRDGNKAKVNEKFSRIETLCKEKLVQNKLLLSLIANNLNYEEILNAFLF